MSTTEEEVSIQTEEHDGVWTAHVFYNGTRIARSGSTETEALERLRNGLAVIVQSQLGALPHIPASRRERRARIAAARRQGRE